MKKRLFFCNSSGTSLIELIMALVISAIVITGIYRVGRSIFDSANREKQKAEMLQSIMSVSNIIERDIRMAGCGLPGNGMRVILNPEDNDYLMMFTNEKRVKSVLTTAANSSTLDLYVNDASGFNDDEWVCLEGPDTIYREIESITLYSSCPDMIRLVSKVDVSETFAVGTTVHGASRIAYEVVKEPKVVLRRTKNDMAIDLGAKLEKISVIPKKASGTVVAMARDADVLTVVLGGFIGNDGNRFLFSDSTEVNIRN